VEKRIVLCGWLEIAAGLAQEMQIRDEHGRGSHRAGRHLLALADRREHDGREPERDDRHKRQRGQ
jgi:hypothetical protein